MTAAQTSYRNLDNWSKLAQFTHADVSALQKAELTIGLHTVDFEGTPIDLLIVPRPGQPMLVTFTGNKPRGPTAHPPFFSGVGVTPPDRKVSFVSIADPVLAESDCLTLGWYAGSRAVRAQEAVQRVIEALRMNLRPSRILFFGGSGGGFAGLQAAYHTPGSGALVWNPQTDICEYDDAFVIEYARRAWDEQVRDLSSAREVIRQNAPAVLPDTFAFRGSRVLYLQNSRDWHVQRHMQPFLKRNSFLVPGGDYTGRVGQGCYLHLADWGEGHAPVPKHALTAMLRSLLDPKGPFWRDDDGAIASMIEQTFIEPVDPPEPPPPPPPVSNMRLLLRLARRGAGRVRRRLALGH
ncbi:hypothetical protein DRW48_09305 [Paracoccus suum]|uniref:Alpha/beta hydrolase n=1 Tax=Paracoccus suum TaxID=2259340 RepID=A0A344PKF4_9RHOB|nr:hypothetical protein [Paracoccus suum]AXC49859.1 hypothetical protein DRW48_09305 [Paracoccus suum]